MPTPVSANYRIVFQYVTDGFTHKLQHYCDTTPSGDASGRDVVARTGFSNAGVSVVMDRVWNILAPVYSGSDAVFGEATLEQRIGTVFNPIYSQTTTVTPTFAHASYHAFGATFWMSSTTRVKMPLMVYEWGLDGEIVKIKGYASLGSTLKTFIGPYINQGTVNNDDPYAWRQARDGSYMGRYVSWVNDSNEKLRRLRRVK